MCVWVWVCVCVCMCVCVCVCVCVRGEGVGVCAVPLFSSMSEQLWARLQHPVMVDEYPT